MYNEPDYMLTVQMQRAFLIIHKCMLRHLVDLFFIVVKLRKWIRITERGEKVSKAIMKVIIKKYNSKWIKSKFILSRAGRIAFNFHPNREKRRSTSFFQLRSIKTAFLEKGGIAKNRSVYEGTYRKREVNVVTRNRVTHRWKMIVLW